MLKPTPTELGFCLIIESMPDFNTLRYALDFDLLNRGSDTLWGNLGYWVHTDDYPTACHALAHQLAQMADLQANHHLLDVGFGAGQQLIEWQQSFGVRHLAGVELSPWHYALAKAHLQRHNIHADIVCQSATDLQRWHAHHFDRVLSLDSAYHYNTRRQFFAEAHRVLKPDGRLVLADILLADHIAPLRYHTLRAISPLASMSAANMLTVSEYHAALTVAGFTDIRMRFVEHAVLGGFARFALRHWRRYAWQTPRLGWTKIMFTALLIRQFLPQGWLRYGLVSATKP